MRLIIRRHVVWIADSVIKQASVFTYVQKFTLCFIFLSLLT